SGRSANFMRILPKSKTTKLLPSSKNSPRAQRARLRQRQIPESNKETAMQTFISSIVLVVVLAWGTMLLGQEQKSDSAGSDKPDPKKVKELMHRKLENSQKILEALTLNDLDKAAKHSAALLLIQKEAAWNVHKTKEYEMWSDQFRQSAQDLVKAAKERNLESAKLNYLGMTMACFHCHSYVRDLGMTRLDLDPRDQ